jgi:transposase
MAHSARDILTIYKDQHGTEQNYGFLKDPVIVNSLFLKKPERIEALGLILLLALLLWRLMERTMRQHVDTTMHIKLAPCGRTICLARRTPWYPHYIRDIPPWA